MQIAQQRIACSLSHCPWRTDPTDTECRALLGKNRDPSLLSCMLHRMSEPCSRSFQMCRQYRGLLGCCPDQPPHSHNLSRLLNPPQHTCLVDMQSTLLMHSGRYLQCREDMQCTTLHQLHSRGRLDTAHNQSMDRNPGLLDLPRMRGRMPIL